MSRHAASERSGPRDTARIRALASRVAGLERQIEREIARPLPNTIRLSELKRQKLWLKDQIRSLIRRRARGVTPTPAAPPGGTQRLNQSA